MSLVQKTILLLQTLHGEHPHYLFKLISSRSSSYVTRNIHNLFFKTRHTFLKNAFFPSTIIEWNKLDHNIRNSNSFNIFRKSILKFIRLSGNSFFNCHNPRGIKFIKRLRLGLGHLWSTNANIVLKILWTRSVVVVWIWNQLRTIFTVPLILLKDLLSWAL